MVTMYVLSILCPLLASIYFLFIKFVDELPFNPFNPFNHRSACGWWRLDEHARRVRTLYMETNNIVISPCIYLGIHAMRGAPLLPCLKEIYILDDHFLDLSSALLLASESTLNTVQLDVNAITDWQFFVPFLSTLYMKSPGLSHLALRGFVRDTSMETVYCFSKLQSLEIRFYGLHFRPQLLYHLHKLGQLSHLLDLTIDTHYINVASTERPINPISSISNSANFRQLKRLQILGNTTLISCILNEMRGLRNLNALKIVEEECELSDTEISWGSSFEAISTFSAVEDIEITHDLKITHDPDDEPEDYWHYTLSASSLDPLLKLENLKSFINDNISFSGTDEDFLRLASGFPKLKKFVVPGPSPSFTHGELGRRTLACLYYLSQECPDLREIKIAVSCSISDNIDAIKKLPHPIIRND